MSDDPTVPTSSEGTTDPLETLKKEFAAKELAWEEERKKLNRLATTAQQDYAEANRFLKKVLPKINEVEEKEEKFTKHWEKSPVEAVEKTASDVVAPVSDAQARINHKLALITLRDRYPDFKKFEPAIATLSNTPGNAQYAAWSWTEEGLESLYWIAKGKALDQEVQKKEDEVKTASAKERAFSEDSTGSPTESKKEKMTPEAQRLMRTLGVSEKDFMKYRYAGDMLRDEGD